MRARVFDSMVEAGPSPEGLDAKEHVPNCTVLSDLLAKQGGSISPELGLRANVRHGSAVQAHNPIRPPPFPHTPVARPPTLHASSSKSDE